MATEDSIGRAGGRVDQMNILVSATRELAGGQRCERKYKAGQSGKDTRLT